eukprot:NODE_11516_length_303_cov_24.814961_g10603_i0.p1 GENE.NODE_11516_length_303_cov_24.814961_g10603_i0~~NODE_11516_length_303_cov_24.814961_g10603_i0.p1  ORF type:complete len:83 (+),score=18.32 NODE_11516_length_303_cov_24.814961_g10603_i0:23-250(+)
MGKEAEKNDPNFINNKAWQHIAKRDKSVAKSYLESIDSDTPNTLRMRHALNAKSYRPTVQLDITYPGYENIVEEC